MKREAKDNHFIKKPYYPGGNEAMSKFIQENLQMPDDIPEEGIDGFVLVRYSIDHKGRVTDAKAVSSLHPSCDKEAVRVVKLLKFEVEKQFKARVLFHKKSRVWFRSRPVPENPIPTQIQYSYTTTTSESEGDIQDQSQPEKYSYTIHINPS